MAVHENVKGIVTACEHPTMKSTLIAALVGTVATLSREFVHAEVGNDDSNNIKNAVDGCMEEEGGLKDEEGCECTAMLPLMEVLGGEMAEIAQLVGGCCEDNTTPANDFNNCVAMMSGEVGDVVPPPSGESGYNCVSDYDMYYPVCDGASAGGYCDGSGDCTELASTNCACTASQNFCDTGDNPCSTLNAVVSDDNSNSNVNDDFDLSPAVERCMDEEGLKDEEGCECTAVLSIMEGLGGEMAGFAGFAGECCEDDTTTSNEFNICVDMMVQDMLSGVDMMVEDVWSESGIDGDIDLPSVVDGCMKEEGGLKDEEGCECTAVLSIMEGLGGDTAEIASLARECCEDTTTTNEFNICVVMMEYLPSEPTVIPFTSSSPPTSTQIETTAPVQPIITITPTTSPTKKPATTTPNPTHIQTSSPSTSTLSTGTDSPTKSPNAASSAVVISFTTSLLISTVILIVFV